jgi:hypothetical protein
MRSDLLHMARSWQAQMASRMPTNARNPKQLGLPSTVKQPRASPSAPSVGGCVTRSRPAGLDREFIGLIDARRCQRPSEHEELCRCARIRQPTYSSLLPAAFHPDRLPGHAAVHSELLGSTDHETCSSVRFKRGLFRALQLRADGSTPKPPSSHGVKLTVRLGLSSELPQNG